MVGMDDRAVLCRENGEAMVAHDQCRSDEKEQGMEQVRKASAMVHEDRDMLRTSVKGKGSA